MWYRPQMPKYGPNRDPEAEQRILDAAAELICGQGPGQVPINEIARHAAVGKQTIYRWWPSKTALVIDALERVLERGSPAPDRPTTKENIRLQMRRVAKLHASPTGSLIRHLVAEAQFDAEVAEEFRRRFFTERRKQAQHVIEAGIETGELSKGLDIETVIDLLYGPLWLRMLIGHQPLSQGAVDRILDTAWPALTASPGNQEGGAPAG